MSGWTGPSNAKPSAWSGATCAAQQRAFEAFRQEYNTVRPHERLGQRTPASRYRLAA